MTRRTQYQGSASGRRREGRAHLQSEASKSSEELHRPTLSRAVLSLKKERLGAADVATKVVNPYGLQVMKAAEHYDELRAKAIEKDRRRNQKVLNESGRQIHAVQKVRGSSIPLI